MRKNPTECARNATCATFVILAVFWALTGRGIRLPDSTRPPSASGAQWSPFDPATVWFSGYSTTKPSPPAMARDSVPLGTLVTLDPRTEAGGPVPVRGRQGEESPNSVTTSAVSSSGGRGSGHWDGTTAMEGGQGGGYLGVGIGVHGGVRRSEWEGKFSRICAAP